MKKIISILLLLPWFGFSQNAGFPILKGPYFGQKSPGIIPEIFAPEILVKPKQAHSNVVFSKEGTEAYWCFNGIWFAKLDNGKWTTPELVPFSKKEYSDDAPFLSPDGTQLFFTSKRPVNNYDTTKKENIWVVDLRENGWPEARPLPPVINEMFQHWQLSIDLKRNLYFGHRIVGDINNKKDIYFSKYEGGKYQKPEKLGKMINSEHNENNPYINPMGDYLIFTRINNHRLEDGKQDISLFISFKLQNDTWTKSINLKKHINFQNMANCAIVTQDEKYLFFLDLFEGKYQRYWINAKFIEELKVKLSQ